MLQDASIIAAFKNATIVQHVIECLENSSVLGKDAILRVQALADLHACEMSASLVDRLKKSIEDQRATASELKVLPREPQPVGTVGMANDGAPAAIHQTAPLVEPKRPGAPRRV